MKQYLPIALCSIIVHVSAAQRCYQEIQRDEGYKYTHHQLVKLQVEEVRLRIEKLKAQKEEREKKRMEEMKSVLAAKL